MGYMPDPQQGAPGQVPMMSLETSFVSFYLRALETLQSIWIQGGEDRDSKLEFQLRYLISLIPDVDKRQEIHNIVNTRIDELGGGELMMRDLPTFFKVVSAVIEFITGSFELLHSDIMGPATTKQYRDAILELPDMPVRESVATLPPLNDASVPTGAD